MQHKLLIENFHFENKLRKVSIFSLVLRRLVGYSINRSERLKIAIIDHKLCDWIFITKCYIKCEIQIYLCIPEYS